MSTTKKGRVEEIQQLIDLMHKEGVVSLKVGDIELHIPTATKYRETEYKAQTQEVDLSVEETDEELLFWSVED